MIDHLIAHPPRERERLLPAGAPFATAREVGPSRRPHAAARSLRGEPTGTTRREERHVTRINDRGKHLEGFQTFSSGSGPSHFISIAFLEGHGRASSMRRN